MNKKLKGCLSERQFQFLLRGKSSLPGRGFVSETEIVDAWHQHRATLIEFAPEGCLPWAAIKYDLQCTDEDIERSARIPRLFTAENILHLESKYQVLATADQSADIPDNLAESIAVIAKAPLLAALDIAREWRCIAVYHSAFGRPALSQKYRAFVRSLAAKLQERYGQ